MIYFKDYPGFKWYPFPKADGDIYDTWEAQFTKANVISIEGNFYANIKDIKGNIMHATIHDAMDYIRHQAIIKYFDED